MKKIYISLALALVSTVGFAQTKVGVVGKKSPDVNKDAVLELEADNKGLLLPRLALESTTLATPLSAHVEGMTVYNTNRVNDVVEGFYYNDGSKWQQMVTSDNKAVKFFYMPSIVFDTSSEQKQATKDLYKAYIEQFGLKGNTVVSEGAPGENEGGIPHFTNATDLYYYVTDYDSDVFDNISISKEGVMTYDIKSGGTGYSIMNIVFVVKQ